MASQQQIRASITEQIVEALESGEVPPWKRPWRVGPNAGLPANVVSGKPYRGINPLLLEMAAARHGLTSKWWGTFKQWQQMGGSVMPRPSHVPSGKWGTQIVFWSPVARRAATDDRDDDADDSFFVMRSYNVFNVDQVQGACLDHLRSGSVSDDDAPVVDCEPAEIAIAATGADIRIGGSEAFYSPSGDYIRLPPKSSFAGLGEYYETAFHELVHWSEHPSRLDWSRKEAANTYAMGELVAEIGACYLARELGVPAPEDPTNHVAYLGHWLEAMKGDPGFIFAASSQASRAADFILSFGRSPQPEPEEEPEAALSA